MPIPCLLKIRTIWACQPCISLRGRVGRSNRIAYAYLMYRPEKSISEVSEKEIRSNQKDLQNWAQDLRLRCEIFRFVEQEIS